MDMSDDKKSDERYQISKNYENNDWRYRSIETGKIEFAENIDNIEKYFNESNHMDMSDYKDSDERYQISKNDE